MTPTEWLLAAIFVTLSFIGEKVFEIAKAAEKIRQRLYDDVRAD